VSPPELRKPQSHPFQRTRRKILHHDVRPADERLGHLAPGLALEVEHNTFFAAVIGGMIPAYNGSVR
jgi:hypothetical protein